MKKLWIDCDIGNTIDGNMYQPKAAWYDPKTGWIKLEMSDGGKTVFCFHHENITVEAL